MARNTVLAYLSVTLIISVSLTKSSELEAVNSLLKELVEKLETENRFLRTELRDVESDIAEIQRVLKSKWRRHHRNQI
jgi:hypothetical protein